MFQIPPWRTRSCSLYLLDPFSPPSYENIFGLKIIFSGVPPRETKLKRHHWWVKKSKFHLMRLFYHWATTSKISLDSILIIGFHWSKSQHMCLGLTFQAFVISLRGSHYICDVVARKKGLNSKTLRKWQNQNKVDSKAIERNSKLRKKVGPSLKNKQRLSASLTGQNFQASKAVHGSDDIMTWNFCSKVNVMVKGTPQVLTFFCQSNLERLPNHILLTINKFKFTSCWSMVVREWQAARQVLSGSRSESRSTWVSASRNSVEVESVEPRPSIWSFDVPTTPHMSRPSSVRVPVLSKQTWNWFSRLLNGDGHL